MVEFKNATKMYEGGVLALDNVSFTVAPGEFVFIVGASGSGKTTLVKLLLREEKLTSGEIVINDYHLEKIKKKDIPYLRRSMGIVFQDFRLLKDRTVYENVAFVKHITGSTVRQIKRLVPMALDLVGLEDKKNFYPDQLSGGEQQRIALARAIVNNPSIIIADEPTGNLDPEISYEIMQLLQDINNKGITVMVVTHDKRMVDRMEKRVIEIRDGRVIRDEEKGKYGTGV